MINIMFRIYNNINSRINTIESKLSLLNNTINEVDTVTVSIPVVWTYNTGTVNDTLVFTKQGSIVYMRNSVNISVTIDGNTSFSTTSGVVPSGYLHSEVSFGGTILSVQNGVVYNSTVNVSNDGSISINKNTTNDFAVADGTDIGIGQYFYISWICRN